MHALARLVTSPLALLVGTLPVQYWERFPWLPVRAWAFPAGLLTTLAGAWLFVRGWVAYAHQSRDGNTVLYVLAIVDSPPGTALQGIGLLTLVSFAVASPLGWFANYLVLSGFVRAVSAFAGQPLGDPALTMAVRILRRRRDSRRTASAQLAREREEGPDVTDRLIAGDTCGLPPTDIIIVAARRKPDWSAGLVIVTPDGWYRLAEPFDLELPHGLRTAYPLTPIPAIEVLRRWVSYTLPPLQKAPPGLRRR